ncbi:hypothetical protein GIB67_001424, partial [Kingdonia uniflora]
LYPISSSRNIPPEIEKPDWAMMASPILRLIVICRNRVEVKIFTDTLVKTMVEPRRRCYSLPPVDLKKDVVGGILSVTISSGSGQIKGGMRGSYSERQNSSMRNANLEGEVGDRVAQMFVEVELGELTRRTSLVHVLTALEQGRQIHANAIKLECTSDQFVGTLLIDMYAKCGSIQEPYKLFKRMNVRNIASWNAMVVDLAQHGNGEESLKISCSHSGLVSEAYGYFNSMHSMYGIEPKIEHYSCLVDVLGRAGHVHQAKKLIESIPFDPSASMYRALLGGCKLQRDAETGEYVATRLLVLEPFDSAAYVLLSNIYASANQCDKVNETRKMMKSRSIKKDPGYSWIDVKSKVHLFVVDDKSHPQASATNWRN